MPYLINLLEKRRKIPIVENAIAPVKVINRVEVGARSSNSYSRNDLMNCARGNLFGNGNAQLPLPPLLMLDRIVDIQSNDGDFGRGYAIAEFDITPESWFFPYHFEGDPVMPGSLLGESMWQLAGFHLAWSGYQGKGRVLDGGRIRFIEPIYPNDLTLKIDVQIKKVITKPCPMNIANAVVSVDGKSMCHCDSLKIALIGVYPRCNV